MSFKDIQGQPQIVSLLERAFEKKRLPHALLFAGPSGAGQRQVATEVAKILFCEDKKGLEPCGACVHCRQLDRNSHPDLYLLQPEEDSRVIKIKTVRELIARANLKPFQAGSTVFVIDRAECMNEESQNAFLKTLEEPEGHSTFILICYATEKLLPTIRSRVQTLNFSPRPLLTEADPETQAFRRAALDFLLQEEGFHFQPPDFSKLEREEVARLLDGVIAYFREILLMKAGGRILVETAEDVFKKEKAAKSFSEDELLERIEILAEFKERISESANLKLALSVLWGKLRRTVHA